MGRVEDLLNELNLSEPDQRLVYALEYASWQRLGERAGASRILFWCRSGQPFGMFSAWRRDVKDRKENLNQTFNLKRRILGAGLAAIWIKGVWEGKEELSFFVPCPQNREGQRGGIPFDDFKDLSLSLCQEFQQIAVAVSDGTRIGLMFPSGAYEQLWTQTTFDERQFGDAYSRIHGVGFAFIEAASCGGGYWSQLAWQRMGLLNERLDISER